MIHLHGGAELDDPRFHWLSLRHRCSLRTDPLAGACGGDPIPAPALRRSGGDMMVCRVEPLALHRYVPIFLQFLSRRRWLIYWRTAG
jgi:hypothetical protein